MDKHKIDSLNEESSNLYCTDDDLSYKKALEAESLSKQLEYKDGIALSLRNQGWYFINAGDYVKANKLFIKSKALFSEINNIEGIMKCYSGLGAISYYIGDYEDCLRLNKKSLEIAAETNNKERKISALINSAQAYIELNQAEIAIKYALQSFEIGEEIGEYIQKWIVLKTISDAYTLLNNKQESLRFLFKALDQSKKDQKTQGIFDCLKSLAVTLWKKGDTDQAESLFEEAKMLSKGLAFRDSVLIDFGEFYLAQGNIKQAMKQLQEAEDLSKKPHASNNLKKIYLLLSKIEKKQGNSGRALLYLEEHLSYNDIVQNDENLKKIDKITALYEINKKKRESKELIRSLDILKSIGLIGQKITSTLRPEEILSLVYNNIKDLMDASTFGLAYYSELRKSIDYKIFIEDGGKLPNSSLELKNRNSFACWATRNKKEIFLNDVENEYSEYVENLDPNGLRTQSIIVFPLYFDQSVIGLLTIQSKKKNAYTDDHLHILRLICSYIAIAVKNGQEHENILAVNSKLAENREELRAAYKKMEQVSMTDTLTKLFNRRYFYKIIEKNVARIYRSLYKREKRDTENTLSFILLDIDNFKEVNDTYEHAAGDDLLQQLSSKLSETIRKSDVLVR